MPTGCHGTNMAPKQERTHDAPWNLAVKTGIASCRPMPRRVGTWRHDSLARTSLNTTRNVRAPTALAVAAQRAGAGPAYPADVPVVRQMHTRAHPFFPVPGTDFEGAVVSRRSAPHVDRGYGSWHARLLDQGADAPWQLAAMLLQDVPPIVRARTHGWDSDAIGQAIDDGVLNYLKHPERFDPHLADLPHYVAQAAANRLKNVSFRQACMN